MKISDKTDEDVAAILGLIQAPAGAAAAQQTSAAGPQRFALVQRLSIGLAVVLLGGFGLIAWTVTRPSHGDGASVARAAGNAPGRSFANVLLDAPRRRVEGQGRNAGAGDQFEDQSPSAGGAAAQTGSAPRTAPPSKLRVAALSARRWPRPAQRRALQDDGVQKYEIAKAGLTPEPVAPLAFQSDRIADDYHQSSIERPNFALTPAARAERLDALDAVRLLRQR